MSLECPLSLSLKPSPLLDLSPSHHKVRVIPFEYEPNGAIVSFKPFTPPSSVKLLSLGSRTCVCSSPLGLGWSQLLGCCQLLGTSPSPAGVPSWPTAVQGVHSLNPLQPPHLNVPFVSCWDPDGHKPTTSEKKGTKKEQLLFQISSYVT